MKFNHFENLGNLPKMLIEETIDVRRLIATGRARNSRLPIKNSSVVLFPRSDIKIPIPNEIINMITNTQ